MDVIPRVPTNVINATLDLDSTQARPVNVRSLFNPFNGQGGSLFDNF